MSWTKDTIANNHRVSDHFELPPTPPTPSSLQIEGQSVRSATGCETSWHHRWSWSNPSNSCSGFDVTTNDTARLFPPPHIANFLQSTDTNQNYHMCRWEQYSQQDAADCYPMIDQLNEKEDIKSLNKSEEFLYENNQNRRVMTTTNTGMFRAWEMPHLQNTVTDCEQENKYQSWQDPQHNKNYVNLILGEATRPYQRERGNITL